MQAGEASLTKADSDLAALQARSVSGDIKTAETNYETAVLQALKDEHQSIVDMLNALQAQNQADFDAALNLAAQGEKEMNSAQTLKTQLDALLSSYEADVAAASSQETTIKTQLANAATQCKAAGS